MEEGLRQGGIEKTIGELRGVVVKSGYRREY